MRTKYEENGGERRRDGRQSSGNGGKIRRTVKAHGKRDPADKEKRRTDENLASSSYFFLFFLILPTSDESTCARDRDNRKSTATVS